MEAVFDISLNRRLSQRLILLLILFSPIRNKNAISRLCGENKIENLLSIYGDSVWPSRQPLASAKKQKAR